MTRSSGIWNWMLVVAIAGTLTVACGQTQEEPEIQTAPPETTQEPVGETAEQSAETVEGIADQPESWYGKEVTITATVGEVFDDQLFNVEEEGIIDVDDTVLVLMPEGSMATVRADETVTVTGEVRRFDEAELRETYGVDWTLQPDMVMRFEQMPVVVARSVQGLGPAAPPATE